MKWFQILQSFHHQKVRIICFQKTHFILGHAPTMKHKHCTHWHFANYPQSRNRGVVIAIHKSLTYQIFDCTIDKHARYINCYAGTWTLHLTQRLIILLVTPVYPTFLQLNLIHWEFCILLIETNECLLTYMCVTNLKRTVANFFSNHAQDPTSSILKWETIRYILQGVLIKHGARLKKRNPIFFHWNWSINGQSQSSFYNN